jgi:NAD(P)-dependent dehydrogenase (short-subunit alcohol dehydrogenase family)
MNETRPIAVVTGASRGLGLETVRALAEGAMTVVLAARAEEAIERGIDGLGSPENVEGRVLDVSDQASVDGFFDWLLETHGRIDVLVNNAGRIYGGFGDGLEGTPASLIADAVDNNALGAWRMIQKALPMMNRAGGGRIVNVSSGMGALTDMGTGAVPYRISKTAMNAMTRIASGEARGGVKVNAVCPGWVRTELGGADATRSVAEGIAGIVWAATLPDDGPNGGFFRDGKPIDW